jgi:hypothetical protein
MNTTQKINSAVELAVKKQNARAKRKEIPAIGVIEDAVVGSIGHGLTSVFDLKRLAELIKEMDLLFDMILGNACMEEIVEAAWQLALRLDYMAVDTTTRDEVLTTIYNLIAAQNGRGE